MDAEKLQNALNTICFGGGGDPPDHCIWGINELLEGFDIDFELEEDCSNYEEMGKAIQDYFSHEQKNSNHGTTPE